MRTVVISGASSGIGRATAERFALAGDCVVNLDINAPQESLGRCRWLQVDTANWAAVAETVGQIYLDTGQLDVVIANAGVSMRRGVLEIQEEDARRIIDVNLL